MLMMLLILIVLLCCVLCVVGRWLLIVCCQPVQKMELDPNHPIIMDLKKETANARDEATRARKGTYVCYLYNTLFCMDCYGIVFFFVLLFCYVVYSCVVCSSWLLSVSCHVQVWCCSLTITCYFSFIIVLQNSNNFDSWCRKIASDKIIMFLLPLLQNTNQHINYPNHRYPHFLLLKQFLLQQAEVWFLTIRRVADELIPHEHLFVSTSAVIMRIGHLRTPCGNQHNIKKPTIIIKRITFPTPMMTISHWNNLYNLKVFYINQIFLLVVNYRQIFML